MLKWTVQQNWHWKGLQWTMAVENPVEVAIGVYSVSVGNGGNNVYLVVGERAVFIDSAHDDMDEVDSLVNCWRNVGSPDLVGIVLTHRHLDHAGGARRLADEVGGEIISSPVEKSHIEQQLPETRISLTVEDGETVDLGGVTLEFVHTPGHTLGSVCVYHREERIIYTGDHILGSSSTSINPTQGDMSLYLESLRKLLSYDIRLICPGHGPLIYEPRQNIESLIKRRMEREGQILKFLKDGPRTDGEVFEAIYAKLSPTLHGHALKQIQSHLVKLERDGKVHKVRNKQSVYRLV